LISYCWVRSQELEELEEEMVSLVWTAETSYCWLCFFKAAPEACCGWNQCLYSFV